MKWKTLIFFMGFFLISFISSMNITNVTISNSGGDNIFINGSATIDRLEVYSSNLSVYNLSSQGTFTNLNSLLSSSIVFYGLTDPIDDIKWDNNSILVRDVSTDINIVILALRGIIVGDFDVSSTGSPTFSLFEPHLDYEVCEYTYLHLLEYGDMNIEKLKADLDTMNLIVSYTKLQEEYMDSFQGGCSDVIMRTLKPEFVCLSIEDAVTNSSGEFDRESVDLLKEEISTIIPITENLLLYYVNNFNEVCSQFTDGRLSVLVADSDKSIFILVFIILVLGVAIIGTGKRYKRLLVAFKKMRK